MLTREQVKPSVTEIASEAEPTIDLIESTVKSPIESEIDLFLRNWRPQPIEMAHSFPAQMYTAESVYQLEQERVFAKRWMYVGHVSQLPAPGSYFTITMAEQPLLLVRDLDGHLRGYFNVCPHRAGPVALDSGQCHRLTCQYHAWTFNLTGELKAMPHMADAKDLNPSDYGLQPVRVETWGPFIFVNLDLEAAPLADQLGRLGDRFDRFNFSNLAKVKTIDYDAQANWKLYMENSSESYHVAMVHPSLDLFKALDRFELETEQHYYTEYFPFLENSPENLYGFESGLYIEGLNDWEMNGTSVTVLYPNAIFVTSPNFVLARMINPQGLSQTHVRFEWFVPDTELAKTDANVDAVVQIYDQVVREDLVMLDHVQQRVRSHRYQPGRLSPELEMGVHRFQQTLMEYLRGAP